MEEIPGGANQVTKPANMSVIHRAYAHDWSTPDRWWDWASRTLGVDRSEIFDPCPVEAR